MVSNDIRKPTRDGRSDSSSRHEIRHQTINHVPTHGQATTQRSITSRRMPARPLTGRVSTARAHGKPTYASLHPRQLPLMERCRMEARCTSPTSTGQQRTQATEQYCANVTVCHCDNVVTGPAYCQEWHSVSISSGPTPKAPAARRRRCQHQSRRRAPYLRPTGDANNRKPCRNCEPQRLRNYAADGLQTGESPPILDRQRSSHPTPPDNNQPAVTSAPPAKDAYGFVVSCPTKDCCLPLSVSFALPHTPHLCPAVNAQPQRTPAGSPLFVLTATYEQSTCNGPIILAHTQEAAGRKLSLLPQTCGGCCQTGQQRCRQAIPSRTRHQVDLLIALLLKSRVLQFYPMIRAGSLEAAPP